MNLQDIITKAKLLSPPGEVLTPLGCHFKWPGVTFSAICYQDRWYLYTTKKDPGEPLSGCVQIGFTGVDEKSLEACVGFCLDRVKEVLGG